MSVNRRSAIVVAAMASALLAPAALAQTKLKVAAIYTVPVEQQWVCLLYTSRCV